MRENIGLYRGKLKDNNEWVYWNVYGELIAENGKRKKYTITKDAKTRCYYYIYQLKQAIIPESIGQYTGLTDKNGKKIFEGDILKQETTAEFAKVNPFEWERYGVVRFGCYDWNDDYAGNTTMGWYIEHLKSVAIQPKNYCVGCIQHGLNQSDILNKYYPMEVIGNIHDNPELLKGGAE